MGRRTNSLYPPEEEGTTLLTDVDKAEKDERREEAALLGNDLSVSSDRLGRSDLGSDRPQPAEPLLRNALYNVETCASLRPCDSAKCSMESRSRSDIGLLGVALGANGGSSGGGIKEPRASRKCVGVGGARAVAAEAQRRR